MKRLLAFSAVLAVLCALAACEKNVTGVLPPDYWCSYLKPATQKLYSPTLGDTISITEMQQFWYVCANGMPDTTTRK